MDESNQIKVVFVVGATATGKSGWALDLAKKHKGCLINIDSVQFYKGLEIGSASPTDREKKEITHYLYNYVESPTEMTAGNFIRDFYQTIHEQKIQGPVFVVGGTGFYIQALEKGMYNVPTVDSAIKLEIETELKTSEGVQKLFLELRQFDPESKIHFNDLYRLGRAIEVKRAFGKKMTELEKLSELERKNRLPWKFLKIGINLDKATLEQRVRLRTGKMIEQGIIDEVSKFRLLGHSQWAPLSSVGFFEVGQYLDGQISLQDLPECVNKSTMKLIKKQKTWFKRDPTLLWSDQTTNRRRDIEIEVERFLSEV